jgi:hypothetical protein
MCYANNQRFILINLKISNNYNNKVFLTLQFQIAKKSQIIQYEKAGVAPSRASGPINPLLSGTNWAWGPGTGAASFDVFGRRCKQYAY